LIFTNSHFDDLTTGLLFPRSTITSPTHKQKIEYG
jgi:hypothetical protein